MFGSNSSFGKTTTGFGQSNPQQASSPFGQPAMTNNSGFGTATNTFGSSSGLGLGSNSGFGQQAVSRFGSNSGNPLFGPASTFGSAANTSTGAGLFGSSTAATNTGNTSSFFGSKPAQTSGFGASTTALGSSLSSGPFGSQTSGFGAQQAGFAQNLSNPGTANTPFEPLVDRNPSNNSMDRIQNISAMKNYQQWSQEELRVQDYLSGNKYLSTTQGFGMSSAAPTNTFGSSVSQPFSSNASNSFGSGAFGSSNSAFGSTTATNPTTSLGFGSANQAAATGFGSANSTLGGGFGSAIKPTGFGATTTGFGSTPVTTNAFGSQPATSGFGGQSLFGSNAMTNKTSQTGLGSIGGFGSAATGFGVNAASAQQPGAFGQTSNAFGQPATTTGFGSVAKPASSGFSFGSGTASTGGLFGNTTNTQDKSSMFGQGFGTAATSGTGGIFGSTATGQTTGLFGNKQETATAGGLSGQQPTTSTFGSFSQNQPGTSGLFSAKPQPTNALASNSTGGSSLFGGFGSTQNAGTTGGLFGNTAASSTGTQNSLTGGSLFGNTASSGSSGFSLGLNKPQGLTQTQNSGFSFSNGGNTTNTTGTNLGTGSTLGGGMFGGTTANSGLFGNTSSNNTASSLFGGLNNALNSQNGMQANQPTPLFASATQNPFGSNPLFANSNSFKTNMPTGSTLKATQVKFVDTDAGYTSTKRLPVTSVVLGTPKTINSTSRQQAKASVTNFGIVSSTPRRSKLIPSTTPRSAKPHTSALAPGVPNTSLGMFSESGFLSPEGTIRTNITRLTPKQKVEFPASKTPKSGGRSSLSPIKFNPLPNGSEKKSDALNASFLSTSTGSKSSETPDNLATTPTQSNLISGNSDSLRAKDSRNYNSDDEDQSDQTAFSSGEYWTSPSVEELKLLPSNKLKSVHEFMCGRYGYGQVRFIEPVDLTSVGAIAAIPGNIILFANKVCTVYPDDNTKPSRGNGLNVPAVISLEDCWPVDKATREPIKSMTDPRVRSHIKRLKRIPDTEFIDFSDGKWVFKVLHFSKYGIEDDYHDDDQNDDHQVDNNNSNNNSNNNTGARINNNNNSSINNNQQGFEGAVDAKSINLKRTDGFNKSSTSQILDKELTEPQTESSSNLSARVSNSTLDSNIENSCSIHSSAPSLEYEDSTRDRNDEGKSKEISEISAASLFGAKRVNRQNSLFSSHVNSSFLKSSISVNNTSIGTKIPITPHQLKSKRSLKDINERILSSQNSYRIEELERLSPHPTKKNKNEPVANSNTENLLPSAVKGRNLNRLRPNLLKVNFAPDSQSNTLPVIEKKTVALDPLRLISNALASRNELSETSSKIFSKLSNRFSKGSIDCGLTMGRSSRVCFGPGGTIVWSKNENRKQFIAMKNISLAFECPRWVNDKCSSPTENVKPASSTLNQALLNKATIESQMEFLKVIQYQTDLELGSSSFFGQKCPQAVLKFKADDGLKMKPGFIQLFEQINQKLFSQNTSSAQLYLYKSPWVLASGLFDSVLDLNDTMNFDGAKNNSSTEKLLMLTKKKDVTKWLQQSVKKNVNKSLSALTKTNGSKPGLEAPTNISAKSIYTFLSGNQIDKACLAALSSRNYYLSTLLAQIGSGGVNGGGSDNQLKILISTQLEIWDRFKDKSSLGSLTLLKEYKRIYQAIAGTVILNCNGDCDSSDGCFRLDWLRSFGMLLWYGSSINASIPDVVSDYVKLVESKEAPVPLSLWYLDYFEYPCLTKMSLSGEISCSNAVNIAKALTSSNIFDAQFQFLKLFSNPTKIPLEQVLHPLGFGPTSDFRLPYIFGWMLNQIHGFAFGIEGLSFDQLVIDMSLQLESIGLWHYAVYTLLQLSNDSQRKKLVMDLLNRSIPSRSIDIINSDTSIVSLIRDDCDLVQIFESLHQTKLWQVTNQEMFVLEECRIPSCWLARAKFYRARNDRLSERGYSPYLSLRILDEFRWLVTCGSFDEAHLVLQLYIAPDCIISSSSTTLKNVLALINPNSLPLLSNSKLLCNRPVPSGGWESGGLVYSLFLTVIGQLPDALAFLSTEPSFETDPALTGRANDFSGIHSDAEHEVNNTPISNLLSNAKKLLSLLSSTVHYDNDNNREFENSKSPNSDQFGFNFAEGNSEVVVTRSANFYSSICLQNPIASLNAGLISDSELETINKKIYSSYSYMASVISNIVLQIKSSSTQHHHKKHNTHEALRQLDSLIESNPLASNERLNFVQYISTAM